MTPSGPSDLQSSVDRPRIQAALAALAETEFFVAAPRLHGLLSFLVETTMAEPGLKITQRLVAERFLGRGSDFDPTIDPVVRVAIGRLRVALERCNAAGLNAPLRFEVPKGGYRVTIHDLGSSLGNDGALSLLRKPIAVMPFVASWHGSDAASIDDVLHAAFVDQLSSLNIDLLSIDVLDSFLSDPSENLISASEIFGFELVLSFRPARLCGRQLFAVQASRVDGSLLWSRQYVDDQEFPDAPLFEETIGRIVDDLVGHFGALRVSPDLQHRFSIEPGYVPGLVFLEDYAIYSFRMYELTLANDWYEKAGQRLRDAIERGSCHPLVLAKMAWLEMDKYVFSSPVDSGHLIRGLGLLAQAREAGRDNPYVLLVDSVASLYQGDYLGLRAKVERLRVVSPTSSFYKNFSIWIDALAGRFVDLGTLMERLHDAVALMPTWFWFAPFLEAYSSQRFEDCLTATVSFGCENLFWSALMTAVAYWGLGEAELAVQAMQRALELNPSLADDADHYVACFIADAGLRQSLLADLGAIQDVLIED